MSKQDIIIKEIENDLDWRLEELASMKKILITTSSGSVAQRALLRTMLALLYAHYEGFSKFVWDSYLDAIENDGNIRSKHRDSLIALSCDKVFGSLKGNLTNQNILNFYQQFNNILSVPISFPTKLDTQYNLIPEIYFEKMSLLCLDCSAMKENKDIIKQVVSRRHKIAHGKSHDIKDIKEYENYENAITDVMYELAINTIESMQNTSYKT